MSAPATPSSPRPGPSTIGSSESLTVSPEELLRRQLELERKAIELERKELELKKALSSSQPEIDNPLGRKEKEKNWPPFPEVVPVKPCFYQDIKEEIPIRFQRIMQKLYYAWLIQAGILLVNALVFTLRLIFLVPVGNSLSGFFLSFVYVFICIPFSYICWFRPAYKAFKNGSSFYFMVFFFIFFFQFVTSVGMSAFLPGACQIIDAIAIVAREGTAQVLVGILVLLVGSAFIVNAVLDFYMLIKIHRAYRSLGASFAKAQQEMASAAISNQHVQGAVSTIATQAVRTQSSTTEATAV